MENYSRNTQTNFVEDVDKSTYQKFIEDKKRSETFRGFQKQLDELKQEIIILKEHIK